MALPNIICVLLRLQAVFGLNINLIKSRLVRLDNKRDASGFVQYSRISMCL